MFLQGPHGPFYAELAQSLRRRGVDVQRVAFNNADLHEWRGAGPVIQYTGCALDFRKWLIRHIWTQGVTDIVIYGDTRPIHTTAMRVARRMRLGIHCFEEGYIRPRWITYERGGTNAHSRVCSIDLATMEQSLPPLPTPDDDQCQDSWGDYRQHLWYSAWYHARCLLTGRKKYRYRGHRELTLIKECAWYWYRTLCLPWIRLNRAIRLRHLMTSRRTYHLALLQLSFDASMQAHSDFTSTTDFIRKIIRGFAEFAPGEHRLVLKAHPFEDGREKLHRIIARTAREAGVKNRVVFIDGGPRLAPLLDRASTVITINSTAAQQALWRGLPTLAMGRAVYCKPGLVAEQTLENFLCRPQRPDPHAYFVFRRFLLATSQIQGSFYSRRGRKCLMDVLPEMMLDQYDPYEHLFNRNQTHKPAAAPEKIFAPLIAAQGS